MDIIIFGISPTDKSKLSHNSFERQVTYFTYQMIITVDERETDSLITFEVTDKAFIPEKGVVFSMSSKTGFQIVAPTSLDYLKQPTNPNTISLCVRLAQVAISHNRMFMLLETQDEDLGNIVVPYIDNEKLEKIVKECLLTSLN